MIVKTDFSGSRESLEKMIHEVSSCKTFEALMILSCDANGFVPRDIDPILKNASIPLFGGVFPAIIHDGDLMEKGSIVIGLSDLVQTKFISELSNEAMDYEFHLGDEPAASRSGRTMLVFVDGLSKRIAAFIESLFNVFGLQINYIGGGAGSLSMESMPCLFTNSGMVGDGAVIAIFDLESGVGVSHGWKMLEGPFQVTESDRNVIFTLDWRPAFDLYKEVVESHAGGKLTEDNFFEMAKGHPFGISRMESEQIVRDPFRVGPDRSLVCVGEVPKGSFVSILQGDEASIVDAAGKALALSRAAFPPRCAEGLYLFMDCISRVLFLGDSFHKELNELSSSTHPLVGACTIGEIANCGTEYLEFYNKTAVVAILEIK
jgi:hypothetical protein